MGKTTLVEGYLIQNELTLKRHVRTIYAKYRIVAVTTLVGNSGE